MSSPADVNWLLSTAVQSGAALVAIIGGLLVSRLVTLEGERTSLRRRLGDLRRELDFADSRRAQTLRQRETFEAAYFLNFAEDELFELGGEVDEATLDRLIADSGWEVTDVDRAGMVTDRIKSIRQAFALVQAALAGRSPRDVDSDDIEAMLVGQAHRDDISEALRELTRRTPMRTSPYGIGGIDIASMPIRNAAVAAADRQTRDRRGDELDRAAAAAQLQAERAQIQVELTEKALAALASPPGIARTLGSLVFLSLACLVFPLVIMVGAPLTLALWLRIVVVGIFVLGLGVFFAELVRLLRSRPEPS